MSETEVDPGPFTVIHTSGTFHKFTLPMRLCYLDNWMCEQWVSRPLVHRLRPSMVATGKEPTLMGSVKGLRGSDFFLCIFFFLLYGLFPVIMSRQLWIISSGSVYFCSAMVVLVMKKEYFAIFNWHGTWWAFDKIFTPWIVCSYISIVQGVDCKKK